MKVTGLYNTDTTVTTIEWIHITSPSNYFATRINNTRVLKKQNRMDTLQDLQALNELNETYTKIPHTVFPL